MEFPSLWKSDPSTPKWDSPAKNDPTPSSPPTFRPIPQPPKNTNSISTPPSPNKIPTPNPSSITASSKTGKDFRPLPVLRSAKKCSSIHQNTRSFTSNLPSAAKSTAKNSSNSSTKPTNSTDSLCTNPPSYPLTYLPSKAVWLSILAHNSPTSSQSSKASSITREPSGPTSVAKPSLENFTSTPSSKKVHTEITSSTRTS